MNSSKSVGTDDITNKQTAGGRSRQTNFAENNNKNRDRYNYRKDYSYSRNGYRDRKFNTPSKSRGSVDENSKNPKNYNSKTKPKVDHTENENNKNCMNASSLEDCKDILEVNKTVYSSDNEKLTNQKPPHGHYHHKNSNKPRFAKVFTENYKEQKKKIPERSIDEIKNVESLQPKSMAENTEDSSDMKTVSVPSTTDNSSLINELKVLGQELNHSDVDQDKIGEAGELFEKLKSGENVELDNLKQLYDKIPDITKTEIIKEDEWSAGTLTTEAEGAGHSTCDVSCEDNRSSVCCPHGNGWYPHPPFFHPGYMPAMPHPAYYYAAMWNYHQPIPPPAVHRLASAPSLPATGDSGSTHKRFITRSTKTPGSIVFTLHTTDNLRIVSARCDDEFTMTADLCNEEGVKVAENFDLHSPQSPKLWEQYAFSGNHSIHFNIKSSSVPTAVVVTFMHEITIK